MAGRDLEVFRLILAKLFYQLDVFMKNSNVSCIYMVDWRSEWVKRLDSASSPWIRDWLQHQTRDEFWKHGSSIEDKSRIQIPVLAFGQQRFINKTLKFIHNATDDININDKDDINLIRRQLVARRDPFAFLPKILGRWQEPNDILSVSTPIDA